MTATAFNGATGCVPQIYIFIDRFTSNFVSEAADDVVRQVRVHENRRAECATEVRDHTACLLSLSTQPTQPIYLSIFNPF